MAVTFRSGEQWQLHSGPESSGSYIQERRAVAVTFRSGEQRQSDTGAERQSDIAAEISINQIKGEEAVRYRSGERWQSDTGAESGGSQIQERRAVAVRYDQHHNTGTP